MRKAGFVVALSAFRHKAADYAHVMLPITPFSETPGTFISTEGRVQSFHATVKPLGESRPGWKVMRVLGSLLGVAGFEYETADQVRAECLQGRDVEQLLSNKTANAPRAASAPVSAIQRVADIPPYFSDGLVRRAESLQRTADAKPPRAWMNAKLMASLGLSDGERVLVRQTGAEAGTPAELRVGRDEHLPDQCVRIAAAHAATASLGPMFGTLSLEKVSVQKVA